MVSTGGVKEINLNQSNGNRQTRKWPVSGPLYVFCQRGEGGIVSTDGLTDSMSYTLQPYLPVKSWYLPTR
jgi:hypothetical protein